MAVKKLRLTGQQYVKVISLSPKILYLFCLIQTEEQEKILKRKQRFGAISSTAVTGDLEVSFVFGCFLEFNIIYSNLPLIYNA